MYLNFIKRKLIFIAQRRMNSITSLNDLSASSNALIISFKHELSDTQIYPFYFYHNKIKNKHGVHFQEINLLDVKLDKSVLINRAIKRIYFQHGFKMSHGEVEKYLTFLAEVFPSAKIAFMDWFAPLSIPYACVADRFIDTYYKKQTFKNFDDYKRTTIGDTNLSDYYARRHQLDLPETQVLTPEGFEKKIRLWPNFYLSPQMVDLFLGSVPDRHKRPIDLHARIAVNGDEWYRAMRQESFDAIKSLKGYSVASEGRVPRHRFFDELRKSKFVFSPFGYSEVCWRDYEAYATGALILKPSMSHIEVFSEDFINNKTYIDLSWDLKFFKDRFEDCIRDYDQFDDMRKLAFLKINHLIVSNKIPEFIGNGFL
jgi:hypothetical protein